jgi:uroporphyrinogen decarboxylase
LITGGQAMRTETLSILEALAGRPHIFNLGHGILPQTNPDHVAELVEFVRNR